MRGSFTSDMGPEARLEVPLLTVDHVLRVCARKLHQPERERPKVLLTPERRSVGRLQGRIAMYRGHSRSDKGSPDLFQPLVIRFPLRGTQGYLHPAQTPNASESLIGRINMDAAPLIYPTSPKSNLIPPHPGRRGVNDEIARFQEHALRRDDFKSAWLDNQLWTAAEVRVPVGPNPDPRPASPDIHLPNVELGCELRSDCTTLSPIDHDRTSYHFFLSPAGFFLGKRRGVQPLGDFLHILSPGEKTSVV